MAISKSNSYLCNKIILRMKKNRLYTLNKWNQPASMVDRQRHNIFDGFTFGQSSQMNSTPFGVNFNAPTVSTPNIDWGNSVQRNMALGQTKALTNSFGNSNPVNLQQSNQMLLDNISGNTSGGLFKGLGEKVGGTDGIMGMVGGISTQVSDMLSGGHKSGVGTALKTVGGLVKNIPVLGKYGAAAELLGGAIDGLFGGPKVDEAKLKAANEGTAAYYNFQSNASSFDDVTGPVAQANVQDAWTDSLLGSGAAAKNEAIKQARINAKQWAFRGVDNNIFNLQQDQMNDALASYSAFGGPIETRNMGAIDYDFMSDYLTQKKRENDIKSKTGKITSMPAFMSNSFAIGGDLQTNGGDFSSGLTHINAGQSHELNPNEGVQLGTDPEGVPNLVEEGETVFNDYVYSNRIKCDDATKQLFHISKKRDITYADLSKRLEKEIAERPSDPISKAGFEKQMEMLEEQQERQKAEMEAERAKAAFNALSPEEQTALMQQRAEQEAMAQQQAMAEQQSAMQQPTPEEIDMVQQQIQQMQQADGSNAVLGQEPDRHYIDNSAIAMANGGKINRFDSGGKKNSGKFKDEKADNWGIFTRPGLEAFIESYRNRLNMAETEEQKKAIRKEAIDEFNAIQKGYADIYQDSSSGNFEYSDAVKKHQMNFDKAKGNTGFYSRDDAGNVKNLIAEAIDMPKGHATDDKPDSWYDGYWGPRTSIRNFGSTAYGNDAYYKPLVDEFRELGLTYAPNAEWKHGDNMLYGLSMAEAPATERPADWTPEWQGNNPQVQVITTPSSQSTAENGTSEGTKNKGVIPDLKKETSFGLFGPAVGLGLMGLGVGKPNVASYDAAASGAGNYTTADWMPRGDFLTYKPIDPWRWTNPILANSRATDRAIVNNSGGNRGTAMAGLLANGYNTTIGLGEAGLKGEDANFDRRLKIAAHNADVHKSNQGEYGVTSRFNADAYNNANRASAQMKLHAASAKDDANRWWASNLYGNINGLFDNINQWEKWKRDHNSVARMAANGVFGVGTEDTPIFGDYVREDKKGKRSASNGGKLKKKRGLTI